MQHKKEKKNFVKYRHVNLSYGTAFHSISTITENKMSLPNKNVFPVITLYRQVITSDKYPFPSFILCWNNLFCFCQALNANGLDLVCLVTQAMLRLAGPISNEEVAGNGATICKQDRHKNKTIIYFLYLLQVFVDLYQQYSSLVRFFLQ